MKKYLLYGIPALLLFIACGIALARSGVSTGEAMKEELAQSDEHWFAARDLSCKLIAESTMDCAKRTKGACSKLQEAQDYHTETFQEESSECFSAANDTPVEDTIAPIANDNPDAPVNPLFYGDEENNG